MQETENDLLAAAITKALDKDGRDRSVVAGLVGVTKQAVRGWETTGRIKKSTLKKLTEVLGLKSIESGEPIAKPKKSTDQKLYDRLGVERRTAELTSINELSGLEGHLIGLYRSLSGSGRDELLAVAQRLANDRNPDDTNGGNPFAKAKIKIPNYHK